MSTFKTLSDYEQELQRLQGHLSRAIDDLGQHTFSADPSADREALLKWVAHWENKIKIHKVSRSQTTLI